MTEMNDSKLAHSESSGSNKDVKNIEEDGKMIKKSSFRPEKPPPAPTKPAKQTPMKKLTIVPEGSDDEVKNSPPKKESMKGTVIKEGSGHNSYFYDNISLLVLNAFEVYSLFDQVVNTQKNTVEETEKKRVELD